MESRRTVSHARGRRRTASLTTHLTTAYLMATTRHHTHIDLERLTGIHERRVSVGDDDSYSLATAAAFDALDRAGVPGSVDVVISCSITKFHDGLTQRLEPTMSRAVARAIGARRRDDVRRLERVRGNAHRCHRREQLDSSGNVERALVVSGEYISQLGHNAARHIRNIMSKELASLTLGDAGAALLLERAPAGSEGIKVVGFTTVADYRPTLLAYPKGDEPAARMFTDARGIQRAAMATTPLLLHEVLDAVGISMNDIDHVITHQTSARAIRKGMAKLSESYFGRVLGTMP